MLIPSVDLMGGKAVQLIQGEKKVLERDNPIGLAIEFNRYGEVAVIDLDAALGKGNNAELIKKICKVADCRVGGGIRSVIRGNEYLKAGAKKIIIGTKANSQFLKNFDKNKIIVAVDFKDGYVVDGGWQNQTKYTPIQVIKKIGKYCSEFLITNVDIEGTMQGIPDYTINLLKEAKKSTNNPITYAGGINSVEDIKKLEDIGINSQIGMSIYTKKIDLKEVFTKVIKFDEGNGLIPTIVQDENNQVLMLAYSNKASIFKTFSSHRATYFSRSRKKLWMKGETSGDYQDFIKGRWDCDKDALLYTVKQKNFSCHTGSYSCFTNKNFNFEDLYYVLLDRKMGGNKTSYTKKLLGNSSLLKNKIIEECNELINGKTRENLIWEASDLIYFIMVYLVKHGISLQDVKNELRGRMK